MTPQALRDLQTLFEDTPLSFLGFYLVPAPNYRTVNPRTHRPIPTWMPYITGLLDQGWALLSFYVGLRQNTGSVRGRGLSMIRPPTAAGDGTAHGISAARSAANARLPRGSVLLLDMEKAEAFLPSSLTHMDSWITAVARGGYRPAVYLLAAAVPSWHRHRRNVPVS